MKEDLAKIIKEISKEQVSNLNKIFQNKSPLSLISTFETIIALLRNHHTATNVDVELYLIDYTKLMLKLQRIDAATLDINVVQLHREALARHIKSFAEPSHEDFKTNSPFVAFVCWAQNFCEYAIKVLLAT
jgi:hypothetical protein